MALMYQCITDVLVTTPVVCIAGNHDYPHQPIPVVLSGICDYPTLQIALLKRLSYPTEQDESSAWTVSTSDVDIFGLNCVSHWRRFVFPNGNQFRWLENRLHKSTATWKILICHAPLLAHNPKHNNKKSYLSRDDQLQSIIYGHRNLIYISGHTHISLESAIPCIEYDPRRS